MRIGCRDTERSSRRSRRDLLRLLCGAGLLGLPCWVGCAAPGSGGSPGAVRVELSELERRSRLVVRWRNQPVEVRRTGSGIEALSLVCTHMSCVVRWEAETARYVCPCHDGAFDASGQVVAGPPPEPLRRVRVTLTGTHAVVGF